MACKCCDHLQFICLNTNVSYMLKKNYLFINTNRNMLSCADILLDDFLVAENSPLQSDINSPDRASSVTSSKPSQSNLNYNVTTPKLDGGPDILSSSGFGYIIYCFLLYKLNASTSLFLCSGYFSFMTT